MPEEIINIKVDHSDRICERCEENPAEELHNCPYKSDYKGDETLCNCCDDCRSDCLGSV